MAGRWRTGRGGSERWRGWQLRGEAVGEESCGTAQGVVRQVGSQGMAYSGGGDVPFQPGGYAGGEVGGVGAGEEEPWVAPAQGDEEVGGLLKEGGGSAAGLGDGGEGLAGARGGADTGSGALRVGLGCALRSCGRLFRRVGLADRGGALAVRAAVGVGGRPGAAGCRTPCG
ncbi:hypothetical protein TPA0906_42030 [Streptomyces olivaceus]|nr:hypothetical protein TPA0906_42030 [Streptomyces olivaceus]